MPDRWTREGGPHRRRGVRMLRDRADQPDRSLAVTSPRTTSRNQEMNDLGCLSFPEAVHQEIRDRKPQSEASPPAEQFREHSSNRCSKSALGLAVTGRPALVPYIELAA